uniref:RING-type E3 ubiquitin transferase n=1 Tax=Solanum lycopersicum TaxID=4081 RepID=A0A3Q7GBW1_SOLLC
MMVTAVQHDVCSSEDEDVCPTCLEEYTPENPKIFTKCSHHYHLSCIYEWQERSETCPTALRYLYSARLDSSQQFCGHFDRTRVQGNQGKVLNKVSEVKDSPKIGDASIGNGSLKRKLL